MAACVDGHALLPAGCFVCIGEGDRSSSFLPRSILAFVLLLPTWPWRTAEHPAQRPLPHKAAKCASSSWFF
jgi:hypothetical protein